MLVDVFWAILSFVLSLSACQKILTSGDNFAKNKSLVVVSTVASNQRLFEILCGGVGGVADQQF